MRRHLFEIIVGRQQLQLVTNAQLREKGVDCADLYARASTAVSQIRGVYVIPPIGRQKRQCFEALDDVLPRPRTCKPL